MKYLCKNILLGIMLFSFSAWASQEEVVPPTPQQPPIAFSLDNWIESQRIPERSQAFKLKKAIKSYSVVSQQHLCDWISQMQWLECKECAALLTRMLLYLRKLENKECEAIIKCTLDQKDNLIFFKNVSGTNYFIESYAKIDQAIRLRLLNWLCLTKALSKADTRSDISLFFNFIGTYNRTRLGIVLPFIRQTQFVELCSHTLCISNFMGSMNQFSSRPLTLGFQWIEGSGAWKLASDYKDFCSFVDILMKHVNVPPSPYTTVPRDYSIALTRFENLGLLGKCKNLGEASELLQQVAITLGSENISCHMGTLQRALNLCSNKGDALRVLSTASTPCFTNDRHQILLERKIDNGSVRNAEELMAFLPTLLGLCDDFLKRLEGNFGALGRYVYSCKRRFEAAERSNLFPEFLEFLAASGIAQGHLFETFKREVGDLAINEHMLSFLAEEAPPAPLTTDSLSHDFLTKWEPKKRSSWTVRNAALAVYKRFAENIPYTQLCNLLGLFSLFTSLEDNQWTLCEQVLKQTDCLHWTPSFDRFKAATLKIVSFDQKHHATLLKFFSPDFRKKTNIFQDLAWIIFEEADPDICIHRMDLIQQLTPAYHQELFSLEDLRLIFNSPTELLDAWLPIILANKYNSAAQDLSAAITYSLKQKDQDKLVSFLSWATTSHYICFPYSSTYRQVYTEIQQWDLEDWKTLEGFIEYLGWKKDDKNPAPPNISSHISYILKAGVDNLKASLEKAKDLKIPFVERSINEILALHELMQETQDETGLRELQDFCVWVRDVATYFKPQTAGVFRSLFQLARHDTDATRQRVHTFVINHQLEPLFQKTRKHSDIYRQLTTSDMDKFAQIIGALKKAGIFQFYDDIVDLYKDLMVDKFFTLDMIATMGELNASTGEPKIFFTPDAYKTFRSIALNFSADIQIFKALKRHDIAIPEICDFILKHSCQGNEFTEPARALLNPEAELSLHHLNFYLFCLGCGRQDPRILGLLEAGVESPETRASTLNSLTIYFGEEDPLTQRFIWEAAGHRQIQGQALTAHMATIVKCREQVQHNPISLTPNCRVNVDLVKVPRKSNPIHMPVSRWHGLFDKLKQAKLEDYTVYLESLGENASCLFENLKNESSIIQLLDPDGSTEAKPWVNSHSQMLREVLQSIWSGLEIEPNNCCQILQLLCNITTCSTGKMNGITQSFLFICREKTCATKNLSSFINFKEEVMDFLMDEFRRMREASLKAMCYKQFRWTDPHPVQYVRNVLGHELGLFFEKEIPTRDAHLRSIPDYLARVSKQELLNRFYGYYKVEDLQNQAWHILNNGSLQFCDAKEGNDLTIKVISELFDWDGYDDEGGYNPEYITFDENKRPNGFTTAAALRFLIRLGFIIEEKEEEPVRE